MTRSSLASYRDNQEEVFLGHSVARSQLCRRKPRADRQRSAPLIEEAEIAARQVLPTISTSFTAPGALLEYETLNARNSRIIRGGISTRDPRTQRDAGGGTSIPATRRPRGIGGPAAA